MRYDSNSGRRRWKKHICRIVVLGVFSASAAAESASCNEADTYQGPAVRSSFELAHLAPLPADIRRLPLADDKAAKLGALFEQLVVEQTSASDAAVALWSPTEGYWSARYAEDEYHTDQYWWASVGKLVTAALIQQLVQEGRLSLQDQLAKWFPDFPNASLITIDQMLKHTAGVFSFNQDKVLNRKRGLKSMDELIEVAARHGADFCPGTNWHYSNTGYVMLGHIAERITKDSLNNLVAKRLAKPLALSSLSLISAHDADDSIVASQGRKRPRVEDIASIYGAGAVRSDVHDMLKLLVYLLHGSVTSPSQVTLSLQELFPMFGTTMYYGRGIMLIDVPQQASTWIGHSGGSPHAKGLVVYDVQKQVFLSLVLNSNAPGEAIANALLKFFAQPG